MEAIFIFFVIFPLLSAILVFVDFLMFLFKNKRAFGKKWIKTVDTCVIVGLPLLYLAYDPMKNDCCNESTAFSPEHSLTILVLIGLSVLACLFSIFKEKILSPVVEVLINSVLLIGFILNAIVAIQLKEISIIGCLPISIVFVFQLVKSQNLFLDSNFIQTSEIEKLTNPIEKVAWKILSLEPILKYPVFLILALPIFISIISFLLLFGQKPDSILRVFTDTYKHTFSELDYMCDNVNCGGHFLCSVAARGHSEVVKPIRYGERGGNKIICNRQLLVANAFEELIEEKLPNFHFLVRKNYNKVGNVVHKYYGIFNNKFVADTVYFLMKPLEFIFIITLYTFDRKPENRIARQYLSSKDKQKLKNG
ncbi:DUF6688 family protein [Bernardetia sp.]|uniref:DUF6688 domain-containing protein n=1 Tax=Bernardetia sp. TaxID=1937974 RepID=UPI0025C1C039|nr:DUF6688 family protein [Bernardetia sp.]